MTETRKARTPRRRTMAAGVCLIAVGVLSFNAWATFTASTAVNQSATSSGHMELTIPAAGASNRLTLGASDIAPGDTMQRVVDVTVDASSSTGIFTALQMAITASPSSALDTDADDGLKAWVAVCDVAWTEAGSSPAYTYTCGGTQQDVLATSGSPTAISTLTGATSLSNVDLTPGTANHLMVRLSFPTTADDAFQDLSSTLTFTFSGVQRAGTDE